MTARFTDDYLLYQMARASAAISAAFHADLAAEGVPVADWRILASLHPDAALTVGELAAACLAKQSTMTRMIDRLAARGLVARTGGAKDRRKVTVRLTEAGRARADALIAQAKAHEATVLAGLSAVDVAAFKTTLKRLAKRCGGD